MSARGFAVLILVKNNLHLKRERRKPVSYTLPMQNEDELIRACLRQEPPQQRRLYELYAGRMLVVCLRYTKNRMEAEDILQEGFIKVYQNLEKFRKECPLEQWIKRIMINTALKHLRGQHLVVFDDELPVFERAATDESTVLSDYNFQELLKLIQSLSPGYQAVFNLYAIEGYTHKEIGEMLGISEGTSKSQYARARYQLQTVLTQQWATAVLKP